MFDFLESCKKHTQGTIEIFNRRLLKLRLHVTFCGLMCRLLYESAMRGDPLVQRADRRIGLKVGRSDADLVEGTVAHKVGGSSAVSL